MKTPPVISPHMMPILDVDEEAYFWSKVSRGCDDDCWPWLGESYQDNDYGLCIIRRRNFVAHRVAYWLWHGEQPGKLRVCHNCDNPKCCNPNHLFTGTQRDNMADMIRKGRAHWQRAIA